MKVLMICTVPLYGNGIATCVRNYATILSKDGIQTHILAPAGVPADVCEQMEAVGAEVLQLPNRKESLGRYLLGLVGIVRSGGYDVVHIHGNSCTMAIELLAAKLAGCPARVAHSHNTSCEHQKAHKLLRPVFELCVNGRVACGEDAGKWLFHDKPFQVVKNGIDIDKYAFNETQRKRIRQKLSIDDDTLLLGHVGNFVPAKNYDFLLSIAREMESRGHKKWKLLLVGEGPLFEQVRSEKTANMIFAGAVTDVFNYMQAMDFFLLPSLHEGLPFVLVEAQAAGLEGLVSDQVSQESNMTGNLRFLPIDNVSSWINALPMRETGDRQQRSAEACAKLQRSGYDLQSNTDMIRDYYMNLLG